MQIKMFKDFKNPKCDLWYGNECFEKLNIFFLTEGFVIRNANTAVIRCLWFVCVSTKLMHKVKNLKKK